MRRPATVTVSPNTSPILMLPAAATGSRFKVLGALWLSCRSEAACARVY